MSSNIVVLINALQKLQKDQETRTNLQNEIDRADSQIRELTKRRSALRAELDKLAPAVQLSLEGADCDPMTRQMLEAALRKYVGDNDLTDGDTDASGSSIAKTPAHTAGEQGDPAPVKRAPITEIISAAEPAPASKRESEVLANVAAYEARGR